MPWCSRTSGLEWSTQTVPGMPAERRGPSWTQIPRGATDEAPTCCKSLLDEGEAVAGADELDVAAGQRAPLAGELHGQGGRGAGSLRELESGQQRPHACSLKSHEIITRLEGNSVHPRAVFASKGNEMLKALQVKHTAVVVPNSSVSPRMGAEQTPSSSHQILSFETLQRYDAEELYQLHAEKHCGSSTRMQHEASDFNAEGQRSIRHGKQPCPNQVC